MEVEFSAFSIRITVGQRKYSTLNFNTTGLDQPSIDVGEPSTARSVAARVPSSLLAQTRLLHLALRTHSWQIIVASATHLKETAPFLEMAVAQSSLYLLMVN